MALYTENVNISQSGGVSPLIVTFEEQTEGSGTYYSIYTYKEIYDAMISGSPVYLLFPSDPEWCQLLTSTYYMPNGTQIGVTASGADYMGYPDDYIEWIDD